MPASRVLVVVLVGIVACACGGRNSPASPTAPAATGPRLTAPQPDSPADQASLSSYRPTLVVRNGSSDQAGTRTYEFQVADRSDFSTAAAALRAFAVVARQTGVAEGGGTTQFTPEFDLQPATRFYWRARVVQGTSASEWTPTRNFTTPIAGYSRPGELYDPLVYGSTVGVPVGSTTFVPGRGIRLNDGNSYVRYQLQQPLSRGEFSMEIEGLSANGPGAKLKVFSMMDGTGDLFRSNFLMNAQYRGMNGNPDNAISFKMLLGDPFFKIEPDLGTRAASVTALDPGRAYFWRGVWGDGFRLIIQDDINARPFYNVGYTLLDMGIEQASIYNPTPHYAYLGANNGPYGEEEGSWPGAVYRNVWIGTGPRPQSLGSAMRPPE